jgi:hypothetical protein
LTFVWTDPVDKGGVELTQYFIYMAEGEGQFTQILDAPATVNPSITVHSHETRQAVMYKFRVSAVNEVGEGPLSEAISVIAADLP